jgi:hypothetical protein
MKKRALSVLTIALLLASILIGIQSQTVHAWEYDLGEPAPATNP